MSTSREQKPEKQKFVEDFVQGYLDGHQDLLEGMESDEAHDKLIKIEGYAEGLYSLIYK